LNNFVKFPLQELKRVLLSSSSTLCAFNIMKHADLLKLPAAEAKKVIAAMSDLDRAEWIADRDGLTVYKISCQANGKIFTSFTAARDAQAALRSAQCKWLRRFNAPNYHSYKVENYA
jgi:hypothetical protein